MTSTFPTIDGLHEIQDDCAAVLWTGCSCGYIAQIPPIPVISPPKSHGIVGNGMAPRGRVYRDFADRFWWFVHSAPGPLETECWLWTGAVNPKGYGMVALKLDGKPTTRRAHRVAWELLVGPIDEGLDLDHLCFVRDCVRPLHLEPVTHLENVHRAADRRRNGGV